MIKNWLFYLLALAGSVVFHVFYFGWFSWFLLMLAICLPLFSLLVSIPAMLQVRLHLDLSGSCRKGDPLYLGMTVQKGLFPVPLCRFRLTMVNLLTGHSVTLKQKAQASRWYALVDTTHCGGVFCSIDHSRVYDYLGLFWIPLRSVAPVTTLIYPVPHPPAKLPNLTPLVHRPSRAKPGGGFSEEHELRDYRPGDPLRDIHWKLSAKADHLILREAQEPVPGTIVLTLDLTGTPRELDSILQQLSWLSQWLISHEIPHLLFWIDPFSCRLCSCAIQSSAELKRQMERLLTTRTGTDLPSLSQRQFPSAQWHHHIQPEQEEDL